MEIFFSVLNQISYLFLFIGIGYLLVKCKALTKDAAKVLSRLENTVFIPALVLSTFVEQFNTERLLEARNLLIFSITVALISIFFSIVLSKLLTKESYNQKIYTYGLSFSNFGFMGNAVVKCVFPEIFFQYLIFTIPLWMLIYIWGVPSLLMADSNKKITKREALGNVINPMFIAMILGMLIGLFDIKLPNPITSVMRVSGECMSPIAMILTGVVISSISLEKTFKNFEIYIVSIVRLIIMPVIFIIIGQLIKINEIAYGCALCTLSMPLGLNTIVIPSSYGKDTSVAASMIVISHILSLITIPLIFMAIQ